MTNEIIAKLFLDHNLSAIKIKLARASSAKNVEAFCLRGYRDSGSCILNN